MADFSDLNSNNKGLDFSDLNSRSTSKDNEEKDYGDSPFERGPVQMAMHVPKVITKDILGFLKEEGLPTLGQLFSNPGRAAKNVVAGPLIGLSNIPNIPSATAPYLHHLGLIDKKELEESKEGNLIPHGEYDKPVKKFFGLEEQEPGDALLQMLMPGLPHAAKGVKGVVKSLSGGDKAGGLHLEKLRDELKDKNLSLKDVADLHEKQMAAEALAKSQSTREVGASKSDTMFHQLGEKENALDAAKQDLLSKQQEAAQHEALPEIPDIDTAEPAQNVANAENALIESHEAGVNLGAKHEAAQQALEKHESKVGEHLQEGKAHNIHVGEFFNKHYEDTHTKLKSDYKEAANAVSASQVKMPKPKTNKIGTMTFDENGNPITTAIDVDAVLNQIRTKGLIIKNGKPEVSAKAVKTVTENPVLDELLAEAPTSKITDAGKFMTKYRDFKNAIFKASQRMKFAETAQERAHIAEALPKARKVLAVAEKALEEGIGAENAKKFKELNSRYSKLYDLRENPTMKYVRKHKKTSGNIIEKLSGSGVGQEQMRAIAKTNPKITNHILAQTYEGAKGAEKIHNPGELVSEWTRESPELEQMTKHRENLQNQAEAAKANVERQKQRHAEIVDAHKEALGEAKEAEKEADHAEKEKASRQAASSKFNNEIESIRNDIKAQEETISKYREKQQALEKEAQKSKISLEKKMTVQAEIKAIKEKISESKKGIEKSKGFLYKKIGAGWRVGKGILKGLSKLGSI